MSEAPAAVPPSAKCAEHREEPATFACPRCGDFACASCDFRVRPDAAPMCAKCWEQRKGHVLDLTRSDRKYLPNVALIAGLLGFVPVYGLMFGAIGVIAGFIALGKAKVDPERIGHRRAMAGIICGGLGVLETGVIILVMALR
jgi:hypothetical protein